jgi:hypothetical protein
MIKKLYRGYRVNVEAIYRGYQYRVNVEAIYRGYRYRVNVEVIYRGYRYRVNVEAIYRRYQYRVNVKVCSCFLAQASLFFFLVSLSSGFFAAIRP